MSTVTVKRTELKPGEVLCSYCTARCCRYFALPIETPETWEDYDHMRWYVMHGSCAIFVDEDVWFLMVYGDCKYLLDDYRCGNYEDRPQICRTYTTDECEYDNDGTYDRLFETPEQIWEYAHAVLPPKKKKKKKKPAAEAPHQKLPIVHI